MIQFVQEGGYILVLNILFGVAGLAVAAATAHRPSAARLAVCESAQKTVLFVTTAGFVAGFSLCLKAANAAFDVKDQPDLWKRILIEGTSEALANPIVGFALLGTIALLATVGRMRLPNA